MLTPSGVTRLLDGLQGAGLVENIACESDARAVWAALTDEGRAHARMRARRAHRAAPLTVPRRPRDDEVVQLSELLGRLPGVDAGSCAG